MTLYHSLADWALRLILSCKGRRQMAAFLAASKAPRRAQMAVLSRIVGANENTQFGRRHRFADCTDYEAFRAAVPVQSYEDLRPFIDCQDRTRAPCLTSKPPVFFAQTSGTTADPKLIPITDEGRGRLCRRQQLFAYAQLAGSDIFRGKILAIGGSAHEGYTPGGTPYGSMTGLFYRNMPRAVQRKFLLPIDVFQIGDYDLRYRVIAALALAEPDVTGIATANPSTLIRLISIINSNYSALLSYLKARHMPDLACQPPHLQQELRRRLRVTKERLTALSALQRLDRPLTVADLWPRLAAVVTWTGGSCAIPLKALVPDLPPGAQIIEAGYVSSEFRGSINIDTGRNVCLPTFEDNFFEFVDQDDWERETPVFLTLDEIIEGRRYYVFITTPDGLYRYDMNDIVEVTGRINATPTIAFVQKGKGVTNITGEKLYESQVVEAVIATGCDSSFFVAIADEARSEYRIYLEGELQDGSGFLAVASEIERQLCRRNSEFAAKLASRRLGVIHCHPLRSGAGAAYRRHCVQQGQRDAQFKPMLLQYARDCDFDFERWRADIG